MNLLFFVFLFFQPSFADEILEHRVCDQDLKLKSKSSILGPEITKLREQGLFPIPQSNLEYYKNNCTFRNSQLVSRSQNASEIIGASANATLPASMQITADLVSKVKTMVLTDLASYQKKYQQFRQCALNMAFAEKIKVDSFTQNTFFEAPPALSATCKIFREKTIPMLNDRLRRMRIHLDRATVKKNGPTKFNPKTHKLRHFLFEDTQEIKRGPISHSLTLEPLTQEEIVESAKIPSRDDSEEIYLAYMSQSPILLHFKGPTVTTEELVKAFEQPPMAILEASRKLNDQDYISYEDYLPAVLEQIPLEKRADYCLVASELRKDYGRNPKTKFDYGDVGLLGASFLFLRGWGLQVLAKSTMIFGVLSEIKDFGGSYLAAKDYEKGMQICRMSKFQDEDVGNSLCNFKNLREDSSQTEESFFYLPVFASPLILKDIRELRNFQK